MPRRGLFAVGVGVALVLASLWYVTAPPRSPGGYSSRTATLAETLTSHVRTAGLWARTVARDRALRPTAAVGLREADRDADRAVRAFARLDPPADTRPLRRAATDVADDVAEALAELRLAAQDGAWSRVPELATELDALVQALDELRRRAEA